MISEVEAGAAIIKDAKLDASVKKTLQSRISSCIADAKKLYAEAEKLAGKEESFLIGTLIKTAVEKSAEYTKDPQLAAACGAHELVQEAIFDAAALPEEQNGDDSDETEILEEPDSRLVAVTYGSRSARTGNKKAYKTFLLNYNNYAVVIEYGDRVYTVASGGYVVVED